MDSLPNPTPSPPTPARRVELAWACLVFAAAALIRWPQLQRIPRFTDEVLLWRLAVDVLRGGYRPLVFEDTGYNGPILIYLLAAMRWATASLAAPRLLALALGSASVLLLYLTGRDMHSRSAGLVAAAFLGITATPVLVYSHVLHMTSLVVPLMCLCLWSAVRAARQGSGGWLLLAGLSAGLALQTHPLAAAFLPGLLLWLWRQARGRTLLKGRWGILTASALVIAYSPIIAFHLPVIGSGDGPALSGVAEDLAKHWSKGLPYARGLANLLRSLADALGATPHDALRPWSQDPLVWLMLALCLAGLWTATHAGHTLPLYLATSGLLVLPLLMTEYDNTLLARYSGLLLPSLYLVIGVGAADWLRRGNEIEGLAHFGRLRPTLALLVLTIACLSLAGRLVGFYHAEDSARRSNDDILAIAALAEGSGQPVVLDGRIKRTNGQGTGPSGVLQGILVWRGVELKKQSEPAELDAYLQAVSWPAQVIVSDATLPQLRARDRLKPVSGGHVAPVSDVEGWGLYALEAR